jgi:hypothetical protein
MPVDLAAEHLESSRKRKQNLTGWPEDTVLYEDDDIADGSGTGIVAITATPEKAPSDCWKPTETVHVGDAELFEGCVGYWFIRNWIADEVLNERLESVATYVPESTSDQQRTNSGESEHRSESDDSVASAGGTEAYSGSGKAVDSSDDGSSAGTDPSFCPGCGTALEDYPEAAYCPHCGQGL